MASPSSGIDTIHKSACQCDCGCGAVLITEFEAYGDEPEQVYVTFSLAYHGSLRERLRAARRVIRGKDPWLHSVALQGDGLRDMRQAFAPVLRTLPRETNPLPPVDDLLDDKAWSVCHRPGCGHGPEAHDSTNGCVACACHEYVARIDLDD